LQLIDATKNLLMDANIEDEIAEALKIELVKEALENKLFREEPRASKIMMIDEIAYLNRSNQRNDNEIYKGSKQKVDTVREAYDKTLSQVLHEERIRTIVEAYLSLISCVKAVEDSIDYLILTGRPPGKCSLCLNQSI